MRAYQLDLFYDHCFFSEPRDVIQEALTQRLHKRKYSEFVTGDKSHEELELFYGQERLKPVLGDEDFVAQLSSNYDATMNEVKREEARLLRPSMAQILQVVGEAYGVDSSVLLKVSKGRGKKNIARKVAMYMAQKRGDFRLNEIAEVFGLKHYGGVSNAIYGVSEEVKFDCQLAKNINYIINRLDL